MKIAPWISAALVAALFVSGPLAPMAAFAQAPQAGQERVPVDPVEKMLMPSVEPITSKEPTDGDATAAGFANERKLRADHRAGARQRPGAGGCRLRTFGTGYRA